MTENTCVDILYLCFLNNKIIYIYSVYPHTPKPLSSESQYLS